MMILPPLVAPFLLANSGLLRLLEKKCGRFHQSFDSAEIEEQVFLAQHSVNFGLPDHVFRHRWHAFKQDHQRDTSLYAAPALFSLAKQFLHIKGQRAAVHLDQFGDWQNLLSRMSGLPIQAALFARQSWADKAVDSATPWVLHQEIAAMLGQTTLAAPYDAAVEAYLEREGLHESHMHLNGTTLAEMCWQRAMLDPKGESADFDVAYSKDTTVRELCHTIDPDLTPTNYRQRLYLARQLRSVLLGYALGQNKPPESNMLGTLGDTTLLFGPTEDYFNRANLPDSHQIEAWWLCLALVRIHRDDCAFADRYLQLYLLLQNQHFQLMVQRDDLFGFDQFQKFTLTELREPAEKDYTARFWQMHGYKDQASLITTFEGRFAPKISYEKDLKLVSDILRGYWAYLQGDHTSQITGASQSDGAQESLADLLAKLAKHDFSKGPRKMQLALVPHFVKKEWRFKKESMGYRHAELRVALRLQLSALCSLLDDLPGLSRWICGMDAAANELHAPPEVFAPIFRIAHLAGIAHKTYHVGEDFIHLIGGLRQISDALTLLALDRIGHGTALGLQPRQWLQSMPHDISVKRGEWMIDMVCVWDHLRKRADGQAAAWRAASEAVKLAGEIFQRHCAVEQLHAMLALRGLWPQFVFDALADEDWDWRAHALHDHWREEAKLVAQANQAHSSLELLAQWWQAPSVLACSEKYIQVPARFLNEAELLAFQQAVQQQLVEQGVIIETLPTSNVRISQYQHIRQHHSLRWMGIPGRKVEGDAALLVSLGSDDPGIFATDMRSEFYHLYAVLRNEEGMRDVDALQAVANLNERGRIYRFHGK